MHIKFIAHDASSGSSCSGLVEYLNKENETDLYNIQLKEDFFNQEYSQERLSQNFSLDKIKDDIDQNLGSRKANESNFYMINISPSDAELLQIEKNAKAELQKRGYQEKSLVYTEAKEQLIKTQLKLYTKNVMNEYAANFDREIYRNPEKAPNTTQKRALDFEANQIYKDSLKRMNIEIRENTNSKEWQTLENIKIISETKKSLKIETNIDGFGKEQVVIPRALLHQQKDGSYKVPQTLYDKKVNETIDKYFGVRKEYIFEQLAKKQGFDLSKRQLTGDDLLWYGKVETQRHYNHLTREVIWNKETLQEIKMAGDNAIKIKELETKLYRDKITNEVIKNGTPKGGQNFHVHVLVSRHDKTNDNPRSKISLSPMAAARDKMLLAGKNQVGFNRVDFIKSAEQIFDKKFEYNRPIDKTFEYHNDRKKAFSKEKSENETNKIASQAKGKIKNLVMKHSGINEIKRELNPIQSIKNEIPLANIATSFPKSIVDLSIKIVRNVIDHGIGY